MKEKSLLLAIGLNVLLPGTGHIYLGKRVAGIFACLLVFGIFASTGAQYILPGWTALNVIMGIDALILFSKNKKKLAEATMMKCPNCGEAIQRDALVCRYCMHVLQRQAMTRRGP